LPRLKYTTTLYFALLLVAPSPVLSQGADSEWLAVRALVDVLPVPVVQRIAAEAKGSTYKKENNPEIAERTPRQHIERLCGSIQPGYVEAMPNLSEVDLDTPLGERAYQFEWPACLPIQKLTDFTYRIQDGDTLGTIKRRFTGDGVSNIDAFFAGSGLGEADSKKLDLRRDPIVIPFFTSTVRLEAKNGDRDGLRARLDEVGRTVIATRIEAKPVGEIIGPVDADDVPAIGRTTNAANDCQEGDGSAPYPFAAGEIVEAFRHLGTPQNLSVVIVDNGFFGAPCPQPGPCPDLQGSHAEAENRFPRAIFYDAEAGWGPRLGNYAALNYSNDVQPGQRFRFGDADSISGHGTHVAGLTLGGVTLSSDQRKTLFLKEGAPWLRIVTANLSGGRRNIPAGMETNMLTALLSRSDSLVANLSVAFDGKTPELEKAVRTIIQSRNQILFVAASGNSGKKIGLSGALVYPAAFGGRVGNVLTVASIDGPMNGLYRLSKFSNYSDSYVDIAAPGCKLLSWLDADRDPIRITGTSQAAPIATFAATLLRSVWNTSPESIRRRLMVSGDLLLAPEDRSGVRSRSVGTGLHSNETARHGPSWGPCRPKYRGSPARAATRRALRCAPTKGCARKTSSQCSWLPTSSSRPAMRQ